MIYHHARAIPAVASLQRDILGANGVFLHLCFVGFGGLADAITCVG